MDRVEEGIHPDRRGLSSPTTSAARHRSVETRRLHHHPRRHGRFVRHTGEGAVRQSERLQVSHLRRRSLQWAGQEIGLAAGSRHWAFRDRSSIRGAKRLARRCARPLQERTHSGSALAAGQKGPPRHQRRRGPVGGHVSSRGRPAPLREYQADHGYRAPRGPLRPLQGDSRRPRHRGRSGGRGRAPDVPTPGPQRRRHRSCHALGGSPPRDTTPSRSSGGSATLVRWTCS